MVRSVCFGSTLPSGGLIFWTKSANFSQLKEETRWECIRLTAKGANLGAFSPLECLVNEYGCQILASASLSAARQLGEGVCQSIQYGILRLPRHLWRDSRQRDIACASQCTLPDRRLRVPLCCSVCCTFSAALFTLQSPFVDGASELNV